MIKLNTFISPLIIFLITLSIFLLQSKYVSQYFKNNGDQVDHFLAEKKIENTLTLQKKMPTLGFNNLLADWQYLQFIQYFGDAVAREETGYSLVTNYFEMISDYDPRFLKAYLSLSSANSIYAVNPQKTVAFLEKVIPSLSTKIDPLAFLIWNYKGVDEILFLGDIPAAQNSYKMSAKWALERGDETGKIVAKRNLDTAKFLANNPDSKKAQVSAWATVINNVFDDKTRQMIIEKIKSLGGNVFITNDGKVKVVFPDED